MSTPNLRTREACCRRTARFRAIGPARRCTSINEVRSSRADIRGHAEAVAGAQVAVLSITTGNRLAVSTLPARDILGVLVLVRVVALCCHGLTLDVGEARNEKTLASKVVDCPHSTARLHSFRLQTTAEIGIYIYIHADRHYPLYLASWLVRRGGRNIEILYIAAPGRRLRADTTPN